MADLWRPGDIATLVCPDCWAESREITGQTVAAGSIDRRDSGAMTALRTCERGHHNPAREALPEAAHG